MKRNYALSNLRLFLVLMVLLHHAALAYNSYFHFTDIYLLAGVIPISNLINPIVDTSKSGFASLLNGILDSFFMSTMFFISGMFVWKSLEKKGVKAFIISRSKRLGIPFVIGVLLLIPLSYYPANIQYASITGTDPVSFTQFWKSLSSIGFLSGPFWFVLVLLAFNLLVAGVYVVFNRLISIKASRTPVVMKSSLAIVILLIALSLSSFIPMAKVFGPDQWLGKGILNFQTARIIHYFTYFLAGTWIGAIGIEKTVFNQRKVFGLGWIGWIIGSIVLYFALMKNPSLSIASVSILSATFTVGLTGFFMTFTNVDSMFSKIATYSYGIYIIHYTVSSFVQYSLLIVDASGLVKTLLAFSITTILSLVLALAFRYFNGLVTKEVLA